MTTSPPGQAASSPRRTLWIAAIATILGAALGAALTGGDAAPDGSVPSHMSDTRLSSCQGWRESSSGPPSDTTWCSDMFVWMDAQSDSSMMVRSRHQMADVCGDWARTHRPGASSRQQCADMATWMDGHMASRDGGWMMRDR